MCEYEPSDVHMTNELFEGMEKLLQKMFTMSGIFGMRICGHKTQEIICQTNSRYTV